MLVADVLLELGPGPPTVVRTGRVLAHPPFEDGVGFAGSEVVHDVEEPEDATGRHQLGDAAERHRLPEVGQMVQGVAAVDEVGRRRRCARR